MYKDTDVWVPLTNFTAGIVCDITMDDGVETTRALEIKAAINGKDLTFPVPAGQFAHMNWALEHLGAEAVVLPGQGTKDRARAAIQILSVGHITHRRVFSHTGWREVNNKWVYLHGGGALGSDGLVNGLEVQLPKSLEHYVLPTDRIELTDPELRDAVEASLEVLNVASHKTTVPLAGSVYRAVIGGSDFSIHIAGSTGVKKSELGALAQQHFGPAMHARALPASWSSTANSLEGTASAAKDAVLVIDDFVPQGTTADRARLNALADRVLRAQCALRDRRAAKSYQPVRRFPQGNPYARGSSFSPSS